MAQGIVIKCSGSDYFVRDEQLNVYACKIKGNLRTLDLKSTNPVTVGDKVEFDYDLKNGSGFISAIKERKNYIIRRPSNLSKQYHIIASNIDQAVLVVTLKEPETNTDFIDRYLVAAESLRIPVLIIFNKIDIYDAELLEKCNELETIYTNIGYLCLKVSITTGYNIEALKEKLVGKVNVLNGNSGVGKSSIIKYLAPGLDIKIGNLSDYHKSGMHTTSYTEMFDFPFGGSIIDTPGIRGFGLVDFGKEELYHFFPEIFKAASECKFYNCTHIHEPGCAVIEEVKAGKIALTRYKSYYNLYFDDHKKYRY